MKKLIFLLFALAIIINLALMGIGCKSKESGDPTIKKEAKPAEAPAPDDDDDD